MRFAGVVLACSALALLGFRDQGCGGGGSERVGLNGPCTRPRDCDFGLKCLEGVCVPEDAGGAKDAGFDAVLAFDAPPDAPPDASSVDAGDAGGDAAPSDAGND